MAFPPSAYPANWRLARLARALVLGAIGLVLLPYLLTPLYLVARPISTPMLWRYLTGQRVVRSYVPLAEMAPVLPLTVIAAEDARFCSHAGIDWQGLREAIEEAEDVEDLRGGSTITQQTAKNLFLWQGDTGVWPEHRERGLGRWLKAVNGLRLIEERPEVRWLYTGNAASNRAMLAINDAMGFRPVRYIGAWQVSVDAARRFVASRP